MLAYPLPTRMFLESLLSAASTSGYIGVLVVLARERDARAQHRELTDDWTSIHDVTGPTLAVLCPVPPDEWPRGVRHPRLPRAVTADGMELQVPHMREQFDARFWADLGRRPGSAEALAMPERPASVRAHASGWTQSVTDAAEFFGIEESHVPCIVLLSMGERHGTVIPIDETFGVYEFLKTLTERVGPAPVRLGKALDERERLRTIVRFRSPGLDSRQVASLSSLLAEAGALAPELIVDCRARLEHLAHAEPSDADLQALRTVCDLLRSPEKQAERHNLRTHGLLSRLERLIGKLEVQRPQWEELRTTQEELRTVERELPELREQVSSIGLAGLITQVAAELPSPLEKVEDLVPATPRLPGWSFSRLGRPLTHAARSPLAAARAGRLGLVMVHGFRSKPSMWNPLRDLLADDPELGFVDPLAFGYRTGLFRLNPTRVFPSINVVADSLKEYLATEAQGYERLVLLTHSMGGLVVQRCLTRMLTEGKGHELSRIRRVVLLACPNSGTEIMLSLRRSVLRGRHPHERQLQPLNEEVTSTRRVLMREVVYAREVTERTCPIPFSVYAGESDNIVPAPAAQDVFPDAAALPGGHSSIARPTSHEHRTYTTLRRLILENRLPRGLSSP
ncbi:alpha/beta fold hydrolase [Streptomyces venezuelae]|uniref:alpha/beta fold hydrolase n=1 Tax=Streptomyces venezuelae TaxID=54571 RepID=UPI00331E19F4